MPDNEPLYNPNDGLTGRDGGPYLDIEQARADEVKRARVEGRKPDLDNPPANAGIPLYTAAQMMDSVFVNSHPSQADRRNIDARRLFSSAVEDDDTLLTTTNESIPLAEIEEAKKANKDRDEFVEETAGPNADVTDSTAPVENAENTGAKKDDPFKGI